MRPSFSKTSLLLFLTINKSFSSTASLFRYSEKNLEACAQHFKNHGDFIMNEGSGNSAHQNACHSLYENFLNHYHPDISLDTMLSSPRYKHFIKTARLVHQHNTESPDKGFKLRLNHFADTSLSHSRRDQTDIHVAKERDNSRASDDMLAPSDNWQTDLEDFWEHHEKDTDFDVTDYSYGSQSIKLQWKEIDVRLLDSRSSIAVVTEYHKKTQRHLHLRQSQEGGHQQQTQQLQNNRKLFWDTKHGDAPTLSSVLQVDKRSNHQTKAMMPGDGTNTPPAFSSPQVPPSIHGVEVELHKGLGIDNDKITQVDKHGTNRDSPRHLFAKSLDWSTSQNPDGVPLVHGAFDQGNCGSCWAFAATGSLEASAARNTARDYFVAELARIGKKYQQHDDYYEEDDDDFDKDGYYTMVRDLTDKSRTIESETFQELNLSIQELLDCDTSINDGCIGGSPHQAFRYIHKHGLVRWKEYPYVGSERTPTSSGIPATAIGKSTNNSGQASPSTIMDENMKTKYASTCRKGKVGNPIATVESWGLLHKNHEDLIEYALLYVGPVAAGINGADASFINYGGGIFDSNDCDQNANHALLIVGYGQEDITKQDGKSVTVRYWIARNSWGESWGENGFVRVKRGSGEKGIPGVCGIARSASVALGGMYRSKPMDPLANADSSIKTTARYRRKKYVTKNDIYANSNNSMESFHPVCDSMITTKRHHLYYRCIQFSVLYHNNQYVFLAFISLLCALIAILPLVASLIRQHRLALGNRSIILDHFSDKNEHIVSGTLSEQTHLLSSKDKFTDARTNKENAKRWRGRHIVMTSSEHDPFHLVPLATFDTSG